MIERGRRSVTDRRTLTHITRTLAIPPHLLGIVGPNDVGFLAMLAFGTSIIRLADIARHGGRAEPETMRLLARPGSPSRSRSGTCFPEKRLATAARWTGQALRTVWDLGDRELLASISPARTGSGHYRSVGCVTQVLP